MTFTHTRPPWAARRAAGGACSQAGSSGRARHAGSLGRVRYGARGPPHLPHAAEAPPAAACPDERAQRDLRARARGWGVGTQGGAGPVLATPCAALGLCCRRRVAALRPSKQGCSTVAARSTRARDRLSAEAEAPRRLAPRTSDSMSGRIWKKPGMAPLMVDSSCKERPGGVGGRVPACEGNTRA